MIVAVTGMTRIKIAFASVVALAALGRFAQVPNKMSNLKEPFTKVCRGPCRTGDFKGNSEADAMTTMCASAERRTSEMLMITN